MRLEFEQQQLLELEEVALPRLVDTTGSFGVATALPGTPEIVALMGVEGSGARELLRSFAGLERTTGEIMLRADEVRLEG